MDRRSLLGAMVSAPLASACRSDAPPERTDQLLSPPTSPVVLQTEALGFQWQVLDPFLFCVHHDDPYPAGNARWDRPRRSRVVTWVKTSTRPTAGACITVRWCPASRHTRTAASRPSRSCGAASSIIPIRSAPPRATATGTCNGSRPAEASCTPRCSPLLDQAGPNPLELFQIWLNLPAVDKFAEPHFAMFWKHSIPERVVRDAAGRATVVTVVAGRFGDASPNAPPPQSWASRADAHVAIWTLRLEPGAQFTLPAAAPGTNRKLYYFRGSALKVSGFELSSRTGAQLRADVPALLENGASESELLLLQGKPIAEPVVQSGPFVMNTRAEIQQAYADFRATRFGGWPWASDDPVHGPDSAHFARHPDGRTERAT